MADLAYSDSNISVHSDHKIEERTRYVSPSRKSIERFAYTVCQQLSDTVEASYNKPEVVFGLASFIIFVAEVTVKHLNEGHFKSD
jgi:hypothetical protein